MERVSQNPLYGVTLNSLSQKNDISKHVFVVYKDYRGKQMTRRVLPINLTFGKNQWQAAPEYMIVALDLDTDEIRSIPIKTIQKWRPANGSSE